MTIYQGNRGRYGDIVVKVISDDRTSLLNTCYNLIQHSPDGFEWGYDGSGPAQLAFALLYNATDKTFIAQRLHQRFKHRYIATIKESHWEIGKDFILKWVAECQK